MHIKRCTFWLEKAEKQRNHWKDPFPMVNSTTYHLIYQLMLSVNICRNRGWLIVQRKYFTHSLQGCIPSEWSVVPTTCRREMPRAVLFVWMCMGSSWLCVIMDNPESINTYIHTLALTVWKKVRVWKKAGR